MPRRSPRQPGPPPPTTDPVARAKALAISLLARHGWSVAKLRERLVKRGTEKTVADLAIADLVRVGLMGDRAFAEETARLELSRRPASDAFLEHRLLGKGVGEKTAARAAAGAAEGVSELDRARALARRGLREGADPVVVRRRLLGLLARRGFDAETAQAAVDEVLGAAPEDLGMDGDGGQEVHDEPV